MQTFTFKRSAAAIMAAAFLSPVAMADIGGGGATLPAKAYSGTSASSTADGARYSVPAAGSLFAEALPGVGQSYCQVGSGSGRSVITGSSGNTIASRPCPTTFTDAFVNGSSGFSAPSTDADYAASDAPAGTGDFNAFVTNKAIHTQLTQFPSLAGFVAVIANAPGNAVPAVFLTEAELCNVFAGKITNWNQLAKNTGAAYASKPITVVYRSDSSGTSFGFSNHLNKVCQDASLNQNIVGSLGLPLSPAANNFTVQSTFSLAFPGGVAPAGSVGASGNPGVASAVHATDGAIGYAEAANALDFPSPKFSVARIAAVDTASELDPTSGSNVARTASLYKSAATHAAVFTIPATFQDVDGNTYNGTYTDRALQSNNPTFGRPIGVPTALTTAQAPQKNCVYIVHPGAYATSVYKTAGSPASGYKNYPIAAVTYLLGNYGVNGNSADMETLLGSPYNVALRSSVTSAGANTGYAYLSALKGTPLTGNPVTLNQARINACTN